MTRSLRVAAILVVLAAPATAQDTSPLVFERVIDAPVETVWAAWTTNEGLESWYASHAEVDLRVGGLFRANYDGQGTLGDRLTVEREVLSFEPNEMFSFRVVRLPDGLLIPDAALSIWNVIYFKPLDPDRTQLRVVCLGFDTSGGSQSLRRDFEQGIPGLLQQLQNQLAG